MARKIQIFELEGGGTVAIEVEAAPGEEERIAKGGMRPSDRPVARRANHQNTHPDRPDCRLCVRISGSGSVPAYRLLVDRATRPEKRLWR